MSLERTDQKSEPPKVVCRVHAYDHLWVFTKIKVENLFTVLFLKFLSVLQGPEYVNNFYYHSTFLSTAFWISQSTSPLSSWAHLHYTTMSTQQQLQYHFTDGETEPKKGEATCWAPKQGKLRFAHPNQFPFLLLWGQNEIINRKALWKEGNSIDARCIIIKPNLSTEWPCYHPWSEDAYRSGLLNLLVPWGEHLGLFPAELSLVCSWDHFLQGGTKQEEKSDIPFIL